MTTDPTIVDEHVARAVELAGNCIGYDTAAQVHALAAIAYAIVDGTKSNTTLANDVSVVAEEALNLSDRIDAVDARLDSLKDITQTHTIDIRVLGQRIDAVVNRFPDIDATLSRITDTLDTYRIAIDNQADAIRNLSRQVANIIDAVGE